jgi:hypothetical protein
MSPVVVPRLQGPQIAEKPLPGIRISPDAPSAAFQPPQPVDLSGVQKIATQIHEEETARADQVAVLSADSQLSYLENNLLHGPNGVLNRQGQNVLGAPDEVRQTWTKSVSEIDQHLTNDRQKIAFRRAAQDRFASVDSAVQQHVATEIRKTDAAETVDYLSNEQSAATNNAGNPQRVSLSIQRQTSAILDYAKRSGFSEDQTHAAVSAAVSETHQGVINRMIADGGDLAAMKYYGDNKNQINGAISTEIEKALGLASTLGEAERQGDAIVSSSVTLTGALAKAAQIQEPRVRERTEERIRQAWQDKANDIRISANQAFERAGQTLEQTGSIRRIAPEDWLALSVTDRESLQRRENQMHNGDGSKRQTDPATFYSLLNMSALSDATRQQFDNLNLLQYRGKLSDADFKHIAELQRSSRLRIEGAVSSEARFQSRAAERAATKADGLAASAAIMEQATGYKMPPSVPGAPINPVPAVRTPNPQTPGNATTPRPVPQAWLDHAKRDPNYRRYLQHMGVPVP